MDGNEEEIKELKEKIEKVKTKITEIEDKLHQKMVTDIKEYQVETDVLRKDVRKNSAGDMSGYLGYLKSELTRLENQLKSSEGKKPTSGMVQTRFYD